MTPCETPGSGFESRLSPPGDSAEPALWFVFQGDRMLLAPRHGGVAVPRAQSPNQIGLDAARTLYLGRLSAGGEHQVDCYAAEVPGDADLPAGWISDGLRGIYPLIDEDLFGVAGRAIQLLAWDRQHRYCGQCGGQTVDEAHERAKRCTVCGLLSYPRLSPAIIIAVVREDDGRRELLMARNHRFPPGRYSVLAGYVEPGETLEECARREVCEEVGIRIRDISYFGSQPWPFPNSLMIAFTAAYAGGDIRLEETEIAHADWFTPGNLPGLPPKMSVARRLIDWFVSTCAA